MSIFKDKSRCECETANKWSMLSTPPLFRPKFQDCPCWCGSV